MLIDEHVMDIDGQAGDNDFEYALKKDEEINYERQSKNQAEQGKT